MIALLELYGIPIAASGALSACLAVVGAQIGARDRSMQTLCLTQGALLGVLLGIGMTGVHHMVEGTDMVLPFVGAMVGSIFTFVLSEIFVMRVETSKNTYFAAFFAVLMSGGYLVSAFFPGLESHMTQRYFGDLAVISDQMAWLTLGVSLAIGFFITTYARALTKAAFFENILGIQNHKNRFIMSHLAIIVMLGIISFGIQVAGMLFTITALFVPTTMLSRMAGGYRAHLWSCAFIAFFGSIFGFAGSLAGPHLPTVPFVSLTMVMVAGFAMVLQRIRVRVFKSK